MVKMFLLLVFQNILQYKHVSKMLTSINIAAVDFIVIIIYLTKHTFNKFQFLTLSHIFGHFIYLPQM